MLASPKGSDCSQRRNINRCDAAIKRAQVVGATATMPKKNKGVRLGFLSCMLQPAELHRCSIHGRIT
jgi:hypothetical protein